MIINPSFHYKGVVKHTRVVQTNFQKILMSHFENKAQTKKNGTLLLHSTGIKILISKEFPIVTTWFHRRLLVHHLRMLHTEFQITCS